MKSFYFAACFLLVTAIVLHQVSQRHITIAVVTRARSVEMTEAERLRAKEASHEAVKIGQQFGISGMIAAALGVVAWFRSRRNGERHSPILPLVLLFIYGLGLLAMV